MTVPAYRLPPNVESGAQYGPDFRTWLQEAVAGNEVRIAQWAKVRHRGDISYGIRDDADIAVVKALHMGHFGRVYPFRFKDWRDYQATNENFGTGNGSRTEWQLTKTYDPQKLLLGTTGSFRYVRDINWLATTPTIKVNNVTKTVVTDYTISATGLVTFVSPPTTGHALTWTGEFDNLVRFDSDYLPLESLVTIGSIPSIGIREVVGET